MGGTGTSAKLALKGVKRDCFTLEDKRLWTIGSVVIPGGTRADLFHGDVHWVFWKPGEGKHSDKTGWC